MKNLFLIIITLFVSSIAVSAEKTVDVRLTTSLFDKATSSLYVSVEMKYSDNGSFVLAGQNYRFFYNTELLSFNQDASNTNLPQNKYSSMTIIENMEGVAVDGVNQLAFDKNLGFLNFSIDLTDNKNGGITITENDSWVSVATLKFQVNDASENMEIVWGREGVSDEYATAFVEVSEWIAPRTIETAHINEYIDYSFKQDKEELNQTSLVEVTVGPNPAKEFIKVKFSKELSASTAIILRDVQGRVVSNENVISGQTETIIDINNLASANYFIEISSSDTGIIHRNKLTIVD